MDRNPGAVSRLTAFIGERHSIYKKREVGKPKPWTNDPILQNYRFCNVYREHDTVTKWIAENWRGPHDDDQDLWFAMLVARYVNEPSTLSMLGYPVPWNSGRWRATVQIKKDREQNVFNAAYIIPPTAGAKPWNDKSLSGSTTTIKGPKHEALDRFFTAFWLNRRKYRPTSSHQTLESYAATLCGMPGMGRFFAGQIIADLKYARWLENAPDWWTFAISGPGSRRGLNRVVGREPSKGWTEPKWFEALTDLQAVVNIQIKKFYSMPELHGQDMQNCLCEFDKYERARLGEGKPKQKYNGRTV